MLLSLMVYVHTWPNSNVTSKKEIDVDALMLFLVRVNAGSFNAVCRRNQVDRIFNASQSD